MDKILFFDGHCTLCNNSVDWLMRRDKRAVLKFASLQGETARRLIPNEKSKGLDPDTVIYLRNGKTFDRSTAVLMSLWDVGGVWTMSSILMIIPKFLRDLVYRFVARTRYQIFGRRETCRLPLPHERDRLLP